jgi:hypothetical protein
MITLKNLLIIMVFIVQDYKISNLKQNDVFEDGLIKRIYLTKNGEINLITNNMFTKSFPNFDQKN